MSKESLFNLFGVSSYRGDDVAQYGAELGNGWRLWIMLDAALIIAAAYALVFEVIWIGTLLLCLGIWAPITMTLGYLFGGFVRGFSGRDVIRAARDAMKG